MSEHLIGFLIVFFTASIPCVVFGYLIAFKGKHHLISGWDASKISNANAVGKIIGLMVIFIGVYVLVVTAVWWQKNLSDIEFTLWLIPSAIIPIFALVYCKIKYAKSG
jgi:hypothetical protein